MFSRDKSLKKSLIILLNIGCAILLYSFQNIQYNKIVNIELSKQDEVLRNVMIINANGNDLNWIFGLSLLLLIINLILYKNWVKAKRWILEPLIILIITIGLLISAQLIRVS